MNIILRRPKLGRTSCKEIAVHMPDTAARRCDWPKFRRLLAAGAVTNRPKLFRWGCTANIPEGFDVINTSEAIHQVNDKTGFRAPLNEAGLCPKTWFSLDNLREELGDGLGEGRFIVRPKKHAQGKQLFLCSTVNELQAACNRCGAGYYISEYIPKVSEYRVAIVQGRAVWVAKKTPADANAIAWNVARGGRFDNVSWNEWPLKVVKTAIAGFNLSSLDFGGVDVMVDAEGKCYILEINSAPSLTSPYRQECMGKAFNAIIRNGKERIPLVAEKGGYLKFIHPALDAGALLVGGV